MKRIEKKRKGRGMRSSSGALLSCGFKPVLTGLSVKTNKPPAMRVRIDGYTKKFPKLIE